MARNDVYFECLLIYHICISEGGRQLSTKAHLIEVEVGERYCYIAMMRFLHLLTKY
jgi:hypothetical protein